MAVNIYVSPYGEHVVPEEICRDMRFNKNMMPDMRCLAYRRVEKWAEKKMDEWRQEHEQGQ